MAEYTVKIGRGHRLETDGIEGKKFIGRGKLGVSRRGSGPIPGSTLLAGVATIDPIAHLCSHLGGYLAPVFDGLA